jgi:hypothetical protein
VTTAPLPLGEGRGEGAKHALNSDLSRLPLLSHCSRAHRCAQRPSRTTGTHGRIPPPVGEVRRGYSQAFARRPTEYRSARIPVTPEHRRQITSGAAECWRHPLACPSTTVNGRRSGRGCTGTRSHSVFTQRPQRSQSTRANRMLLPARRAREMDHSFLLRSCSSPRLRAIPASVSRSDAVVVYRDSGAAAMGGDIDGVGPMGPALIPAYCSAHATDTPRVKAYKRAHSEGT